MRAEFYRDPDAPQFFWLTVEHTRAEFENFDKLTSDLKSAGWTLTVGISRVGDTFIRDFTQRRPRNPGPGDYAVGQAQVLAARKVLQRHKFKQVKKLVYEQPKPTP